MGFLDKIKRKKVVPMEEMSIEDLFVKAKKKNSEACFEICRRYFEGIGIEQSYEKAYEYFKRATECGDNNTAIYSLALCYEHGYGVDKNENEAYNQYNKLHENGSFQGTFEIGRMHLLGIGCVASEKKAIEMFKIAASKDIPEAFYYIGVCFNDGIYLKQDHEKAYKYFKKAASLGLQDAEDMVAVYEENGF